MDYNKLALADILKHPRLGVVSFQGDVGDIIGDRIYVRDNNFVLSEALASECDLPSEEEHSTYWKRVNKEKEKGEREMEEERDFDYSLYSGEKEEEPKVEHEKPLGRSLLTALGLVFMGGKVHREVWQDKKIYVAMISNQLCIMKPDGAHGWLISTDDVEAEDWVVWKRQGLGMAKMVDHLSQSPSGGEHLA